MASEGEVTAFAFTIVKNTPMGRSQREASGFPFTPPHMCAHTKREALSHGCGHSKFSPSSN